LIVRYRHHRQPRDPDEREVFEPGIGLDLLERDRALELLHGAHVHDVRLAGGVVGIGIGVAERLRDPDDLLLVAGVVVEHLVALLDRAQVPLRDRVLHPAPGRLLVLHERIEAIVRRLFFE